MKPLEGIELDECVMVTPGLYMDGGLKLSSSAGVMQSQEYPVSSLLEGIISELPAELEAGKPPEARGLERDQVRLLVSRLGEDRILHTVFDKLPELLEAGDVLVINSSKTLNAALLAANQDGRPFELHLSTRLPANLWAIELREPEGRSSKPYLAGKAGDSFHLPDGGKATLLLPYREDQRREAGSGTALVRLWIADLSIPLPWEDYLDQHGFPIRYPYVYESWPLEYYQTIFACEPGSAEMPSAGRAFTPQLVARLEASAIKIAQIVLHTGVASLEDHEKPYEEYFRVPLETARIVNSTHAAGKRVIAVGTTAVRALESTVDEDGILHPGEGWTSLVITPERGLRVVEGLLTGFHEPRSSHLTLLATLAGSGHMRRAYQEAIRGGYLWHEFGDLHLILP